MRKLITLLAIAIVALGASPALAINATFTVRAISGLRPRPANARLCSIHPCVRPVTIASATPPQRLRFTPQREGF
jgi:hypothetical protein